MNSTKLKVEAGFDDFMESETMSNTTESSVENQGGINRGRTEPEKKTRKLRSIKLSRMPSTRKGRSSVSQFHTGYAASSEKSTPLELSDASPNHMNATSSSDAKEKNFQVLPLKLTRRPSFKPVRTITRKSSMKFRRPQLRKSSGGTDLKKKLKNSRSTEPASSESSKSLRGLKYQDDQNPIIPSSEVDSSPYSLKATSSSISDISLERATCSSILKASKFPDRVEIKPGGPESDGVAVLNVCHYSYCSLHGHRHGNNPPSKRFVYLRRRVAKTQKSLKPERQSSGKAKHSGNRKKGLQREKRVFNEDVGVAAQQTTADIRETPSALRKESNENLAESVPGESSSRNPSNVENQNQSDNPVECSGIEAQHHEETSDILNGDHKSIHTIRHPKCRDVSLKEFGDPSQPDKLSLKPDKTMSTCTESVPLDEQAHRDVTEYTASSFNLEQNNGDSRKDVKNMENVSTGGSCELPNSLFSSSSFTGMLKEPTSASEEKNEDTELEHGILQPVDSLAASATDPACKIEVENQNNFKFWKLIHRHMITGLDAELETQKSLSRVNSEEQAENRHDAHEKNESCQDFSKADSAMSIEDQEASSRKLEFSQSDAIKLIQQAFDRILSEIPDNSSDDQSIASDITLDQDFLLKKQDEGKEVSFSTSSNSTEHSVVQDQEKKHLQTDFEIASEEVKAAKIAVNKSVKQMPSSWSNLKKIIILNRFVKSLEKVKNLKSRTTRPLPTHKDPEAEKIHLRHQDIKGRKNSEEWMLDHALCQVISTLAPSQKRKVAMLVQAFETVIPLQENGSDMRPHPAASSPTIVQAYDESSFQNGDRGQKESGSKILPGKALYPEMSSNNDQDEVDESHAAHQAIENASYEPSETSLLCGSREQSLYVAASAINGTDMKKEDTGAVDHSNMNEVPLVMDDSPELADLSLSKPGETVVSDKSFNDDGVVRASHEKIFPVNEEVIERISKKEISVLDSEVCSGVLAFNITNMDLRNPDLINSADEQHGKTECPTEVVEVAQPNSKFLSSPLERSESNFAAAVSKSERQRYTRLWYLIYKHMVSGSSTEDGLQPLHTGENEGVQGADASKFARENNADCQGSFVAGQDVRSQNIEYHNNEIIKLVEDAIDEIPLPEIQDTSDNPSLAGDAIGDQELPEKKHGEEEIKFIATSTDYGKENSEEAKNVTADLQSTMNSEEKTLKSENVDTQKEATRGTEEGNRSKKRVQRNWSNLKKLILLRRFVKALEKVREFNPRDPRYLPLQPAEESEKVLLRRQNMDDRKNSEEWMLDYALQKVVAKLTPERKRRVGLLVEAFETVIPTIG